MNMFGEYIRRALGDLIAYILGAPHEGANAGTYLTAIGLFLLAAALLLFLSYLFFSHRKMPFEKMEEQEETEETVKENTGKSASDTVPTAIPPSKNGATLEKADEKTIDTAKTNRKEERTNADIEQRTQRLE